MTAFSSARIGLVPTRRQPSAWHSAACEHDVASHGVFHPTRNGRGCMQKRVIEDERRAGCWPNVDRPVDQPVIEDAQPRGATTEAFVEVDQDGPETLLAIDDARSVSVLTEALASTVTVEAQPWVQADRTLPVNMLRQVQSHLRPNA